MNETPAAEQAVASAEPAVADPGRDGVMVGGDVDPDVPEVRDDDSAGRAPDTRPEEGPGNGLPRGVRLLEREGDLAADYLETLLDIADLDGDLDMDIEGDRATVDIVGKDLSPLIGSAGETLDALQELTRLAVQRETGVRSRLMLDIGGYRAGRRAELHEVGITATDAVRRTGTPQALPPMTPFERKVVHDAVAGVEGMRSESEGEGAGRFVVIRLT
jgi:spoIIIJ-associated protein